MSTEMWTIDQLADFLDVKTSSVPGMMSRGLPRHAPCERGGEKLWVADEVRVWDVNRVRAKSKPPARTPLQTELLDADDPGEAYEQYRDRDRVRRAFGLAVRDARRAAYMTQRDLGAAMGIARSTIALIETGRCDLKIPALIRIADALRVSVSDLVPPTAALVAQEDR